MAPDAHGLSVRDASYEDTRMKNWKRARVALAAAAGSDVFRHRYHGVGSSASADEGGMGR